MYTPQCGGRCTEGRLCTRERVKGPGRSERAEKSASHHRHRWQRRVWRALARAPVSFVGASSATVAWPHRGIPSKTHAAHQRTCAVLPATFSAATGAQCGAVRLLFVYTEHIHTHTHTYNVTCASATLALVRPFITEPTLGRQLSPYPIPDKLSVLYNA